MRSAARALHRQARASPYPLSAVQRCPVPDHKVPWRAEWPEYRPAEYTAAAVLAGPPWADPPLGRDGFWPRFNQRDGPVDRRSHGGRYELAAGRPRNPAGRTGLAGRGLLGRWGPNHAADPIVTRWKRDGAGRKVAHPASGRPVLQVVAVRRADCGLWALPGGMVGPGEAPGAALLRELAEEALGGRGQLRRLLGLGPRPLYRGYVDDPRNTDCAWVETEALHYHDETGEATAGLALRPGGDAAEAGWAELSRGLRLYGGHGQLLALVAERHGAHWAEA